MVNQNKGQDDIKAIFDGGFKSISEQVRKDTYQDKLQEILLVLSALPEKLETAVLKSQNELCNSFTKEVQVRAYYCIQNFHIIGFAFVIFLFEMS